MSVVAGLLAVWVMGAVWNRRRAHRPRALELVDGCRCESPLVKLPHCPTSRHDYGFIYPDDILKQMMDDERRRPGPGMPRRR